MLMRFAWVFLSVFIGFPTTAILGKSRPCIVFGRRTKAAQTRVLFTNLITLIIMNRVFVFLLILSAVIPPVYGQQKSINNIDDLFRITNPITLMNTVAKYGIIDTKRQNYPSYFLFIRDTYVYNEKMLGVRVEHDEETGARGITCLFKRNNHKDCAYVIDKLAKATSMNVYWKIGDKDTNGIYITIIFCNGSYCDIVPLETLDYTRYK